MKTKKKRVREDAPTGGELVLDTIKGKATRKGRVYNTLPPWKGPSKSRSLEVNRIKRRLSFLVVSGKRNTYIRKQLGITQKTLDEYLQNAEVQESIQNMSDEIYTAAEREYQSLFLDSISCIRTQIHSKDGQTALQAIEMLWKAHGRLLTGKATGDVNVYNQQLAAAQAGVAQEVDRDSAGSILEFLKLLKSKEPPDKRQVMGVES